MSRDGIIVDKRLSISNVPEFNVPFGGSRSNCSRGVANFYAAAKAAARAGRFSSMPLIKLGGRIGLAKKGCPLLRNRDASSAFGTRAVRRRHGILCRAGSDWILS